MRKLHAERPAGYDPLTVTTPVLYRDLPFRFDCDRNALPRELHQRFHELELGAESRAYIDGALTQRHGRLLTALHRALAGHLSDFDVNGLLRMYPMHLLGTSQWRALVGESPGRRHLDVGAGSGDVTVTLSPLSGEVFTTEMSWAMAKRLRERGFVCHRVDVASTGVPDPPYDLITCLNVIDRCERPRTLLAQLRDALSPDGRLVVATPLPLNAFFYDGGTTRTPAERLAVEAQRWEGAVVQLIERVMLPLGLSVETLSRAPYLSGGDSQQPLYSLDDVVLVCRRAG